MTPTEVVAVCEGVTPNLKGSDGGGNELNGDERVVVAEALANTDVGVADPGLPDDPKVKAGVFGNVNGFEGVVLA